MLPVGAAPNVTGQPLLSLGAVLVFGWIVVLLIYPRAMSAIHLMPILGVLAFAAGVRQSARSAARSKSAQRRRQRQSQPWDPP